MKIIRSIKKMHECSSVFRNRRVSVGFVPTMGFIHEGHLRLIRQAQKECNKVVVSIFVNPIQFGKSEDYSRYPRNERRDIALLKKEKVDVLFMPTARAMYPPDFSCYVRSMNFTDILCGASRPRHFDGVMTVVCKLFSIVQPDRAFFGQKDYQQYFVLQRMVVDLNIPTKLVLCPIVRDKNGLALSSRNEYLSEEGRIRARSLSASLFFARKVIKEGEKKPAVVTSLIKRIIEEHVDAIDYIAILNAKTLGPVKCIKGKVVIAIAAYIGKTRLIDNVIINRY